MYQFYIQGQDKQFQVREGYQLPNGFAACKGTNQKWSITDVLSGALICDNEVILDNAKKTLEKLMPKIEAIRNKATYKEACRDMADYVASIPEEKRITGWKRYFRNK